MYTLNQETNISDFLERFVSDLTATNSNNNCVGLCTTARLNKTLNYYSYPRTVTDGVKYWHLIINSTSDALSAIDRVEHLVSHWFVDFEQKNSQFDYRPLLRRLSGLNHYPIEPNAITTDSAMEHILKAPSENVLIIGTGRIAFSLAQRLEIVGRNYRWYGEKNRSNGSSKKMYGAFSESIFTSSENWQPDLVVNTVPESIDLPDVFFSSHLRLFIEVSGASLEYLRRVECDRIRLDATDLLTRHVAYKFNNTGVNLIGHRSIRNLTICSGGFLGNSGDIVVDDYLDPKYVIGIADGCGGFLERLNRPFNISEWIET